MIVLIDNYDSFSYNVYQLIGSVEPDIKVIRNDEYSVKEIEEMKPEALILSPGPGRPAEAVRQFDTLPENFQSLVSASDIRQSVKLSVGKSPMQRN